MRYTNVVSFIKFISSKPAHLFIAVLQMFMLSSMWFVLAPIRIEVLHYCIPVFKSLAASCSLIVLLLIFLVQVIIYLVSFAPAINVRPLVLQAGLFVGVSTDS